MSKIMFTVLFVLANIGLSVGVLIAWFLRRQHPRFHCFLHCKWYKPVGFPASPALSNAINSFTGLSGATTLYLIIWVVGVVSSVARCRDLWKGFGKATVYSFAFVLFPILRKSPISKALGTSFERSVRYHRWLGMLIFMLMSIHGLAMIFRDPSIAFQWNSGKGNNLAGGFAWIAMAAMFVSSLPYIRRRYWEVFQYSHLVLFPIVVIFATLHDASVLLAMLASFLFFTPELIFRIVRSMFYSVGTVASVASPSNDILCISIRMSKPFHFEMGQYIFLSVPSFSSLQWHPFSIVPLDDQQQQQSASFQLFIKDNGPDSFTRALIAGQPSPSMDGAGGGQPPIQPNSHVYIDGPFGSLSFPVASHNSVVLIGGGIGATPMLGILNGLIETPGTDQHRKIMFVLTARSRSLLNVFSPFLASVITRQSSSVDFQYQLFLTASGSAATPAEMQNASVGGIVARALAPTVSPYVTIQDDPVPNPAPSTSTATTSATMGAAKAGVNAMTVDEASHPISNGRPDFRHVLENEVKSATGHGEKFVAVCVCGPMAMMDAVEAAVYDVNMANRKDGNQAAVLLLHRETFSF